MKTTRFFSSVSFHFSVVKFPIYLNRRVFVMALTVPLCCVCFIYNFLVFFFHILVLFKTLFMLFIKQGTLVTCFSYHFQ